MHVGYYEPKLSKTERDPVSQKRRVLRTGGEYITFFYVGQIGVNAVSHPLHLYRRETYR